jgi:hypothetical protein
MFVGAEEVQVVVVTVVVVVTGTVAVAVTVLVIIVGTVVGMQVGNVTAATPSATVIRE